MLLLLPFSLLLIIAIPLFLVGGAVAIYLTSKGALSVHQLYILLGVAIALMTLLGAGAIDSYGDTIEYTVDQCMERGTDGGMDDQTVNSGTEFGELSPEAQDVFRSALQASRADDEYMTRKHPDEFELQRDTETTNEIQYESECYELTAQYRANVESNILGTFFSAVGWSLAVALTVGGLVKRERRRRQRWIESDSLEDVKSERCPNCDESLGQGSDECQRCGWSSTDDDTQEGNSSQPK
ncbi:hypothetical protein [Halovenus sp. HT40]|uniref:hypothetical protein n=1 Tax=Halovenus sp. HT40 TaxID=3126691 RepID=UPI00300F4248